VTYSNHTGSAIGSYTATASIDVDTDFYLLEGSIPSLTWSIVLKELIMFPVVTDEALIYNGIAQIPEYFITKDVIVITEVSINAGSYTLTFRLKDPNTTQWEDLSTQDIIETYTIEKAPIDLNEITLNSSVFLLNDIELTLENIPEGVSLDFTVTPRTGNHHLILNPTYSAMNYHLIERETPLSYTVVPNEIYFPNQNVYIVDETLRFDRVDLKSYESYLDTLILEENTTIESFIIYSWNTESPLLSEALLNRITYHVQNPSKTLFVWDQDSLSFIPFIGGTISLDAIILEASIIEVTPEDTPTMNVGFIYIASLTLILLSGGFILNKIIKNKTPY
jgi:hypothetical protein